MFEYIIKKAKWIGTIINNKKNSVQCLFNQEGNMWFKTFMEKTMIK